MDLVKSFSAASAKVGSLLSRVRTAAGGGYLFSVVAIALSAFLGPTLCSAQQETLRQPLTVRWRSAEIAAISVAATTDADRIFLSEVGGWVVAVSIEDGKLLWRSELGGQIVPVPLASPAGVFVGSESLATKSPAVRSGQLRKLTSESGLTMWATSLSSPWIGAVAASSGTLYGCNRDGRLVAVSKSDGRVLWSSDGTVQCIAPPALDNDSVVAVDARGDVIAFAIDGGGILWRRRIAGGRLKNVAVDASGIYAGTGNGRFFAFSRSGQLRWSTRAGNGTQSMVASQEGLVITSLDNYVYFLAFKNGKRRWKYRLDGRPVAAPLLEGNSVFLLDSSGAQGVVLDLKTGKPVNRLALGSQFEANGDPVLVKDRLILPTRQGLIAFAPNPAP